MKKPILVLALILTLMLLTTACAGPEPAPSTSPESVLLPESPSSALEPAPEPETSTSEPESAPESSSEPPAPTSTSQGDSNPADMNPSTFASPEEEADYDALMERVRVVEKALFPTMTAIKDSYEGYFVYDDVDTMKVCLKVRVIDETKVDQALAAYQGEPWDILVKEKGRCSWAQMEAFVEELKKMEVAPGVPMFASLSNDDILEPIYANAGNQPELRQKVKDLAREMGIPEDMIWYGREDPGPGPIVNPDT